jgi:VWFA-related protein
MSHPRVSLALLFALTLPAAAQNGRSAPAPAPSVPIAPSEVGVAKTAPIPIPITTLKANAQLVVVDVIVTDSKQAPVHNLQGSDFTVLENNATQHISSFEEHVALPPSQAAAIAPMRPLPPGLFTNFTPVPVGSSVNVLLLDSLNTPMKDQAYVMNQLREYLKNTPQGTRIAIFALNGRLVLLQGFTADPAVLKAVIEKTGLSASATSTSGAEDPVGNGGTLTRANVMGGVVGGDMGQVLESMGKVDANRTADDAQLGGKTTLDAMNQLAHYLAGVPGRKNLIWFSGKFPFLFDPQLAARYHETTNLLASSRVAVYPVGARGLTTNASSIGVDMSGGAQGQLRGKGLANAQGAIAQDNAGEDTSMDRFAADTGGHAYTSANGLSEAVGKAVENGSNYYTIAYSPTNSKQNGEFRKIQVKLARQGLTLSYRSGYYADDAEVKPKHGAEPVAPTHPNALTAAMTRGAPDATAILLKLQVLPASTAQETVAVQGNELITDPVTKLKAKGPFRRYAIDIAADAKDIKVSQTPDGHFQFSTEMLTYVYAANGRLINVAVQKARGNLTASTYANMRRTGLPFHQEISVPADGQYYLRTAIHDLETDRFGAVELPVASIANLTPVAASAAAVPAAPASGPR